MNRFDKVFEDAGNPKASEGEEKFADGKLDEVIGLMKDFGQFLSNKVGVPYALVIDQTQRTGLPNAQYDIAVAPAQGQSCMLGFKIIFIGDVASVIKVVSEGNIIDEWYVPSQDMTRLTDLIQSRIEQEIVGIARRSKCVEQLVPQSRPVASPQLNVVPSPQQG